MPHLKGMDTWLWVAGGVVVAMLCFVMFLQIFSSMTVQNHTQASLESQSGLSVDVNKLCSMGEGEGMSQTLRISVLATDFFASDNGTSPNSSGRTYGKKVCMNISGVVSCQDLDCTLEMDDLITQKKILNFIDKLRGAITYRDYDVDLVRTKCGVSVLLKGSGQPGCICGNGTFETPMYCNYNGRQPLMLVKDKVVMLTDAETWIAKNSSSSPDSEKLYANIANYLGGTNILVVYEENLTDPKLNAMNGILSSLRMSGFWITVRKHGNSNSGGLLENIDASQISDFAPSGMNFSAYDQVWLVTPGFCEDGASGCEGYEKWTVNEKKNLVSFATSGKGLLIVTDSSMIKGIYRSVKLDLINGIMHDIGFPYEQVLSCVCGCDGQPTPLKDTVFENHTLTSGVKNISVVGAAVLKETCIYSPSGYNATSQASCGPDGLCALHCPAGDPDCSCLEQSGHICNDKNECLETLLNNTGSKFCCSAPCVTNPNECENTSDVSEGGTCICTGQCESNLSCDKTKHCCPAATEWNGTNCTQAEVCSSPVAPCNGNYHWTHFGSGRFFENVGLGAPCGGGYSGMPCPSCDYFEVCHSVVKPIAEEVANCCNSKCADSGVTGVSCHSLCLKALSDSGLSSTETGDTLKKCYGLYAIYGMGSPAAWTQGYGEDVLEQPASVMLSGGSWMCTGYSTMLTTILRSVGYSTDEAFSVISDDWTNQQGIGHEYNMVKFPGDSKLSVVDTVGNCGSNYIPGTIPHCVQGGQYPYCHYRKDSYGCSNDAGARACPTPYGC